MADINPLTGQPLPPWQMLVIGPPETWNTFDQGPRRTVVDTRPGAVLPAWIVRLDVPIPGEASVTTFYDNGDPGGSYQADSGGAYRLPDIVTTAPAPVQAAGFGWGALLLVGLLVAIAWSGRAD